MARRCLCLIFISVLLCVCFKQALNETCEVIGNLTDLSIRDPDDISPYFVDGSGDLLTDYYLEEGWYGTQEGAFKYKMTDESRQPDMRRCSTYWPIYLQGNHPNDVGEDPVDAMACLANGCSLWFPISIRNCAGEFHYYLKPTHYFYYTAYCFSEYEAIDCPGGEDTTNVEISEVIVSVELKHEDVEKDDTVQHNPYFIMRCNFKVISTTDVFKFAVSWYEDGKRLTTLESTKRDELVLHESSLTKLGIQIKCGVQAKKAGCGQITQMVYSKSFYAGIIVLNSGLVMKKGEQGVIKMKTSVPIGCSYKGTNTDVCKEHLRVFDHENSDTYDCNTKAGQTITTVNPKEDMGYCAKAIKSLYKNQYWDPNEIFTFNVTTIDETYEDKIHFNLKLEFDLDIGHRIWRTFEFPDIVIRVTDTTTYTEKICYSHVDPHMRTADNNRYENQYSPGKFVLYRNLEYAIEVQETIIKCNRGVALCACGVAIRAGQDVFVLDQCGGPAFSEFMRCGDGILQVVKKTDRLYEVFTPIGTKIALQLHTGHYAGTMNIDITMAPKDENHVDGLCGKFDGDKTNDFVHRNFTSTPYKQYSKEAFIESWRVMEFEDLLDSQRPPLRSWGDLIGWYCRCNIVNGEMTTICAPSQYLNCQLKNTVIKRSCRVQGRTKRKAVHKRIKELKRITSIMNSMKGRHMRIKREISELNITHEEAVEACTNRINGSLAVRNYSEMGGDEDPAAVIEQCVYDVESQNDFGWAGVHEESVNIIVKSMMEYQPTYVANNTEKVEIFLINTCPGNCSGNGECTIHGNCTCNSFYHGSMCSIDERDQLTIDDIEGGGECDLADGDDCDCYTIRTDNLLDGYKCKIHTTLYFVNETNHQTASTIEYGEYEDIFTGVCCATNDVRTDDVFGVVYEVAISNDGKTFSDGVKVDVYNSACQDLVSGANPPFRLKNQTCFIDGLCHMDGDQSYKQTSSCLYCESSVNAYTWTEKPCPTTTTTITTTTTATTTTSSTLSSTSVSASVKSTTNAPPKSTETPTSQVTEAPIVTTRLSTETSNPTTKPATTSKTTVTSPKTTSTPSTKPATTTKTTVTSPKTTSTPTTKPVTTTKTTVTSQKTTRTTSTKPATTTKTTLTSPKTISQVTKPVTTEAPPITSQETSSSSTKTTTTAKPTGISRPTTETSSPSVITDTSTVESDSSPETSSPFTLTETTEDSEESSLGLIIGLSTGVPVVIIVTVIIAIIVAIKTKKIKSSGLKGEKSGHVATDMGENDMKHENSFYFENPLNKNYKGIPVARSGQWNVEGQTFTTSPSSQSLGSLGDLSAVSVDFKTE